MGNGPNGLRGGLSENEVRTNISKCSEFVYMCGAELWSGGENGNGGEWVEPVQRDKALQEGVNSGAGVERASDLVVGDLRVMNEG